MARCKHLKGDGNTWYECSLKKGRCGYQRYCTQSHKFELDGCKKCPAYKEQEPQRK